MIPHAIKLDCADARHQIAPASVDIVAAINRTACSAAAIDGWVAISAPDSATPKAAPV